MKKKKTLLILAALTATCTLAAFVGWLWRRARTRLL